MEVDPVVDPGEVPLRLTASPVPNVILSLPPERVSSYIHVTLCWIGQSRCVGREATRRTDLHDQVASRKLIILMRKLTIQMKAQSRKLYNQQVRIHN